VLLVLQQFTAFTKKIKRLERAGKLGHADLKKWASPAAIPVGEGEKKKEIRAGPSGPGLHGRCGQVAMQTLDAGRSHDPGSSFSSRHASESGRSEKRQGRPGAHLRETGLAGDGGTGRQCAGAVQGELGDVFLSRS
jgi:hypothetical protein